MAARTKWHSHFRRFGCSGCHRQTRTASTTPRTSFPPGWTTTSGSPIQEIKTPWFPLGEDILLIDLTREEDIINLVLLATELGTPVREHLRGTILTGTGRWSTHGLLGPLPSDAYQAVSHLTWGTVSSVGDLPAPLPAPPSSHRWWGLSASLSLFATLLCWFTFGAHATHEGVFPLTTEFHHDETSLWVQFDVEEEAIITMVSLEDNRLRVMNQSFDITDKAQFAVGDGTFRARTFGEQLLLVSTARKFQT